MKLYAWLLKNKPNPLSLLQFASGICSETCCAIVNGCHSFQLRLISTFGARMKLGTYLCALYLMFGSNVGLGQNKWGFESMVNALLQHDIDTISSNSLNEQMRNGEVILIDAREPDEYAISHINGAVNYGFQNQNTHLLEDIAKDSKIVVYCSIGKRSEDVARSLQQLGFNNVQNLWGGIFDWTNHGFEVQNAHGEQVLQVHPYNSLWGVWVNKLDKAYEPR